MLAISDCAGGVHTIAPGATFKVAGAADRAAVVMLLPLVDPDTGRRVRVDLTGRLDVRVAQAALNDVWQWLAQVAENGGRGYLDMRAVIANLPEPEEAADD